MPFVVYKYSYRCVSILAVSACAILLITFAGCKKETEPTPPLIELLTGVSLISGDTSAAQGDSLCFRVHAVAGSDPLVLYKIFINGQPFKDSTMNSTGFEITEHLMKGADTLEEIRFIIRDRYSREASVTVKVTLEGGVTWGPVVHYTGILLGAQNQTTAGGFYSLQGNQIYTLLQAFGQQQLIDLLYYYEPGDENTIASPGANISASIFSGPNGLDNWTVKRTTRFKAINLSPADFSGCTNDSLLIVTYGISEGNRKAKNLAPGLFFSFLTQDQRYGIFRVESVSGTDAGTILIDIVTQQ